MPSRWPFSASALIGSHATLPLISSNTTYSLATLRTKPGGIMASTSQQAPAGARAPDEAWGRPDSALLALTATTLILLAAQFALAGFGAFTKIRSPAADAYAAHMVLAICVLAG